MSSFFTETIEAAQGRVAKLILRVRHDFLAPLYANAYALIANQVVSAGLGVVYWGLAAHLFSADAVGQNSALISTMVFLSALAELSLKAAMGRFVPRAGRHVARLILSAYAINTLAALLVTLGFFALGDHFRFTIKLLEDTRILPFILIFVPLFYTIFYVQDGVLIGLRESKWVLYENTIYNVLKIFLLVFAFFFFTGYQFDIAASWFLPTALLILLVNGLVFFRFIPRYISTNSSTVPTITVKQIASSVTGDHIGNIIAEACVSLMPLMVLNLVGERANAYFYQAWLIGNALYLVASNLVASFSVEASFNLQQIAVYSRRILIQKARLVAPQALVIFDFCPLDPKNFWQGLCKSGYNVIAVAGASDFSGNVEPLVSWLFTRAWRYTRSYPKSSDYRRHYPSLKLPVAATFRDFGGGGSLDSRTVLCGRDCNL